MKKNIIFATLMVLMMIGMSSCQSTPAPGEPGNRQRYRPLIHHLRRNKPDEFRALLILKKDDPEKYKKQLSILNDRYQDSILRTEVYDGGFTCGCKKCKTR